MPQGRPRRTGRGCGGATTSGGFRPAVPARRALRGARGGPGSSGWPSCPKPYPGVSRTERGRGHLPSIGGSRFARVVPSEPDGSGPRVCGRRRIGQPDGVLSPILIDVERPRTTSGTTSAHHALKATVGEAVPVVALVVKDGHDQLGAAVHWSAPSGRSGRAPLRADGDRWVGTVSPAEVG